MLRIRVHVKAMPNTEINRKDIGAAIKNSSRLLYSDVLANNSKKGIE